MNFSLKFPPLAAALLATLLAACASMPAPNIRREGNTPRLAQDAARRDHGRRRAARSRSPAKRTMARRRRRSAAAPGRRSTAAPPASPLPNLAGTTGEATFNFEGESLHAVVKAILGDMLGQNYVIAPGVQGTVTLATPKPVSPAAALSLLEMVLGWNNARMVYSDGRYNIVPADQAVATGAVAPRTGSPSTARGFEVRAVPLRYISATEMEKLLKPYARPNSIVSVDNGRNLITISGTRGELENYLRTIEVFDVDWMSSMSVGVFPLQSGKAAKVVADLEKVFGEQSKSPVAGMFRFMPLEGANAVLAITAQPDYLDDIQQWIDRIDGAGDGVRLFSYELKYINAKDLAERLAEVYRRRQRRFQRRRRRRRRVADAGPGIHVDRRQRHRRQGRQLGDDRRRRRSATAAAAVAAGRAARCRWASATGGNAAVTLEVDGDKVGVSAVDETNTLLVRSTRSAWKSIKDVIEQLDVMPMQVHIEAQVAEVTLTGELQLRRQLVLRACGHRCRSALGGRPRNLGRALPATSRATSQGGTNAGLAWTFLGRNAAAVISALDKVTDVQMLQTPSLMVRNNYEATLNVGSRIPISSVSFNPDHRRIDTAPSARSSTWTPAPSSRCARA